MYKDLSLYYYLISGFIASDSAGCSEFAVEFINQSIGAVSYEWDFGDGETSDIKNPIKSFTNTTDTDIWRKVTLITTGFSGNKDTSFQSIHIYPDFDLHINKDGKRLFEVFSENLCSYDSLSVIDIYQSPYILKQFWEINGTSFEQNSTIQAFTYPIPDNNTDSVEMHKIKLTLYGTMSDACYTSDSAIVKAFPEVLADFYTDKTVYYSGDSIHFYNQSNRNNLNYIWDFGDGTTKTEKDPFHQYQTLINSNFSVSLVAYSEFCKDTSEKELTILQQVSSYNNPINESQILQVYPNPFDNYFSVQIKTEADESVKIEITNYEGKSIKTLANSVFKAGNHSIGSDCYELKPGMYFLKVFIGDNLKVFKIIKK
ncbi:MAG: PKD domain-containing protein [Ignavibacteriaceae bacterium]